MTFYASLFPPGDPSLPLLNQLQAENVCTVCFYPHDLLPLLNDFKTIPHPQSTRISTVTAYQDSLIKFTNYRQEQYFRSRESPPVWYYARSGTFMVFCAPAALQLENTYGLLISRKATEYKDGMFKGYVRKPESDGCEVWFCEREFTCGSNVAPPPGFPALDACENCSPHSATCFAAVQSLNNQVMTALKNRFQEKYTNRCKWMSKFPVQLNFQDYPIYALFDLSIKTKDKWCNGGENERLLWPVDNSSRWIHVHAPAGFGKSTLVSILAHQWAHGVSEVSNYSLCLILKISKSTFNYKTLRDFVSAITENILDSKYSVDTVERALTANSEKLILLLDGYDTADKETQHLTLNFLQTSDVLRKSTILITTRPTEDQKLLKLFGKKVIIHGFSSNYLRKYVNRSGNVPKDINLFCDFYKDERLDLLSELSPYFTAYLWRAIRAGFKYYDGNQSLYYVLLPVFQQVVNDKLSERSKGHLQSLLINLAKLLFRSLLLGKRFLELEDLKKIFSEDLRLLVEWNMFHRVNRDVNLWCVNNKILAVFFATMYLRNAWSKMNTDEERRTFLSNVFCSGKCVCDYIQGEEALYCIGLVPDIVLKFSDDLSLESASFEMMYDVERIENSTAFDSMNLLSRVRRNFLGRFGFKIEAKDDERFLKQFGFIFDFASLKNCTVDYFFFTNTFEGKQFVKVDIRNGDESIVLESILRAKTPEKIDRIHIDFAYFEFEELFDFVRALLSQFLRGFNLPEKTMSLSPTKLVLYVFWAIFKCIGKRSASVTCRDQFNNYLSLEVLWNRETSKSVVNVSSQSFRCKQYNRDSFNEIQKQVLSLSDVFDERNRDIRIFVNLF